MRVLIVEDDLTNRVLFEETAASLGYKVTGCADAESAWEAYLENDYPLILLDWILPGMDGLEFCRRVRANPRGDRSVILMVTIRDRAEDLKEVLEAGASDYLTKPINVELLRVRLLVAEQAATSIAQRLQMEAALRRSRQFTGSILDSVGQGVSVIDRKHNILSINNYLSKLIDRPREECFGRKCYTVYRDMESPCNDCPLKLTFQDGQPHHLEHVRALRRNKPIDISIDSYPILDEEGHVVQVIEVINDITERLRMEKEVLDTSAAEKRRIGQDLHDGLGQQLTGIAFLSKCLAMKLASNSVPEADEANGIVELVNDAISYTRALSRGLSPVGLEDDGLIVAIQGMASNVTDMFNVACLFDYDNPVIIKDNVVATHLYRITQEAVNNALKHGNAKAITISLSSDNDNVALCIEDDGMGLNDSVPSNSGMGLRLMRYRARMIGASLEIEGNGDCGTRIFCTL